MTIREPNRETSFWPSQHGQVVGTATSLSMTMWVRGGAVPCEGVRSVGTGSDHRRRTGHGDGADFRYARDPTRWRDVSKSVSHCAFRASFYEHFGYGLVERRQEWDCAPFDPPAGQL